MQGRQSAGAETAGEQQASAPGIGPTVYLPWHVGHSTWLVLIVGIGAGLRFYALAGKTVWLDEAFSIWIAQHRLPALWAWLIQIDHHPPLYYMLLAGWQSVVGDLQGPVRALSALLSTLTLPFFYGACRHLTNERTALMATAILAVAPFHVRFAQEARMYALLTLAVAVALYCAARILTGTRAASMRSQWPLWIGLAVGQAAAMLSHNTATVLFPLALNLPVLGLAWVSRRSASGARLGAGLPGLAEPGFARRWLVGQGMALLLWAPWAIPFVIQARVVDEEFWLWPPTVGMVWDTLTTFNFAFLTGWWPLALVLNLFYWGLAVLGCIHWRRFPGRVWLLLSLLVAPFVVELLVSLRRPIFYDRTLIWTTLPYYLLMAAGMQRLGRLLHGMRPLPLLSHGMRPLQWLARRASGGALALVLGISLVALVNYYTRFEKEDWAAAAAYVAASAARGDLILFNATWVQIPFEYYFRHHDTDAELRGLPVDMFDRGALEPKMTEADLPAMRGLLAGHEQVWLVYSHEWYTDPDEIILSELRQTKQEVEEHTFVGLRVFRFAAAP